MRGETDGVDGEEGEGDTTEDSPVIPEQPCRVALCRPSGT